MMKFSQSLPLLATLFLHALLNLGCSPDNGEDGGGGGAAEQQPSDGGSVPLQSPDKEDETDGLGEYEPICPEPYRVEEDIVLPGFVPKSFRYKAIDYTLESAVTQRTTICEDEQVDVDDVLVLQGKATNRLEKSLLVDVDLRLILSDGTQISGTPQEWLDLDPEAQDTFAFQFKLPEGASLAGSKLEPKSTRDAGEHHRVSIPLDAVYNPTYPLAIPELGMLEAETLSEDTVDHWRMKVLSATVTLDSDYDTGKHAGYSKKFVELIVDAHLVVSSVDSIFWYNTFELNVGGFSVYPKIQANVLKQNQRETVIILFEVDENVTEFDFIYDLEGAGLSENSPDFGTTQKTITVRLADPNVD
jgi:hypothetical protein